MFRRVAAVLGAVALAGCTTPDPIAPSPSPTAAIQKLGYEAVALPSTAYGPGSLVTSVKGSGFASPLKLTYLCRPDFTNAPPPIIDTAASSEASREFNGTFKLDATALADLGISAGVSNVESVTMKFSNVKIEQLAFDDLATIRSQLGPVCADLVESFKKKSIAYQTKGAIRADVVYTANFKRGASAEVKSLVIESLKASFGGSVQSNSNSSIQGNGLYYGLLLVKVE
ncbi:hypothetical protein [Mesorhizobium neociceri]|uniref:Lipoprotein n=1 Tax=Mesorhizobium neociceri TaxID=1307853 RepID=A0A838B1Q4_9HYPH|nr:hypothetical protein [Mesorhizobium neociceri]MBA1139937.1 hypothetical protein [Mesorhizobium neociceri]